MATINVREEDIRKDLNYHQQKVVELTNLLEQGDKRADVSTPAARKGSKKRVPPDKLAAMRATIFATK